MKIKMKTFLAIETIFLILLCFISGLINNCATEKGVIPMAEEIDLLMNKVGNSGKFTVDTAVNFVNVVLAADPVLHNGDGNSRFTKRDHFQLLSFGCVLPLGFEFYENDLAGSFVPPRVNIYAQLVGGGASLPIIPDNPYLPWANYEMNLGNYNNLGATFSTDFELKAAFTTVYNQRISMIGVDLSLHGEEFHCPIMVKVLHTIPLL